MNAKLKAIDPTVCTSIEELCSAMTLHFPALTEYAQPQTFWRKYRAAKSSAKPSNRVSRKTATVTSESDDSKSSDSENDQPLVLPVNRSPPARSSQTTKKTPTRPIKTPARSIIAKDAASPSQSESECEIQHRATRMTRKRLTK